MKIEYRLSTPVWERFLCGGFLKIGTQRVQERWKRSFMYLYCRNADYACSIHQPLWQTNVTWGQLDGGTLGLFGTHLLSNFTDDDVPPPLSPHSLCHRILTPPSSSTNQSFLSACLSSHTPSPAGQELSGTPYSRGWGRRWDATLVLWDISGWHFGLSPACLQSCILKCYHFRQILQGSANTVSNILLQRLFHIFCHCCSVTPSATWQAADSSRDIR